jgi:hypothetical protein
MSHRFSKLVALTGVSAALAIGGAGIAQASPDHSSQKSPDRGAQTKEHHGKRHEKRHGKRHEKRHGKRDSNQQSGNSRR